MDQLVISSAHENAALQIDCQSLETKPIPVSTDLSLLVVHSGVKRGLVTSEYNMRREQCEKAAQIMQVSQSARSDLDVLKTYQHELGPLLFKRAHHVISENQRTLDACHALQTNNTQALSRLMAESHASMRDDFEITCPEIDTLVDMLTEVVGDDGGVRMTGGGFGGCVIALVKNDRVPMLIDVIEHQYSQVIQKTPWYQTFSLTSGVQMMERDLSHST